jgi:hypothetical protein
MCISADKKKDPIQVLMTPTVQRVLKMILSHPQNILSTYYVQTLCLVLAIKAKE